MSKAVTSSSPSILPSPSPPLSSRGQSAATFIFAKHVPLINYEPITKKGIQQLNPQIGWIYTTSGKPEPKYEPVEEKKDGSHLGTIYKIVRAIRKANASKWLGKIGQGLDGLKDDPNTKRTRSKKELNFDAIREKIGYDLYQEFGRGIFCVPKTRLSRLPILNRFITLGNLSVQAIIQSIEGRTLESLRIMSRYIDGYHDFKDAFVAVEGFEDPFDFITFLHNYRRPPDSILTPDRKRSVPLRGLMGLLAVGRMLGDTDIIGGRGDNAGFVWVKDSGGEIIAAQVYKIDPGECFKFDLKDTASNGDLSPSANWVVNTLAKKIGILDPKYFLNDEKDLQVAQNNGQITVVWSSLSDDQKDEFLATLFNCSRYLQAEDILKYLFYRDGQFNRSEVEQIPEVVAKQYQNELRTWFEMQLNIYGEELQQFKLRYPEQVLRAVYIDRYGELALPTSEETFPIRELFTQLELIEVSKKPGGSSKRSSEPPKKMAPDEHHDSLTNTKRNILLEDLFSRMPGQSDEKPPLKVLVLGNPGTGKSTLCQKSAHDWASGRLWSDKFKAVVWIQSRQCNAAVGPGKDLASFESSENWLGKAVSHLILGQPGLFHSFQQLIRSHKREILVVFDGIDEASPEVTRIIDHLLSDPELAVLMTSRREASTTLHPRVDRIVENSGFSEEQMMAYTERFFQRRERALKGGHLAFLGALKQNPQFIPVSRIPLYLQMLCALWEQKERRVFPATLTALYGEMGHLLFQWHYHKLGKNTSNEEQVMYCLGELAYQGLEAQDLATRVIQDGKIAKADLLASGLLRESRIGEFEFIHLTFQEFLAAWFISRQPPEIQKRVVIEKRYHPRFQIVIRFLAGIINGSGSQENLERSKEFFRWLYSSTPKMGADLLGFSQFELAIACLNECPQIPLHSWVHQNFNHQEIFLHIMQCESPLVQESRQGWFDQLTDSIASTFTEVENTNFTRKGPCKFGRCFERYPLGLNIFWENLCRLLETKDNPSIVPGALVTVARYGKNIPASFIHRMVVALAPLIQRGILGALGRVANIITTKDREIDYGVPLRALGEIGTVASGEAQLAIVDTLVEALDGSNLQVRYGAASALEEMAKTFPEQQIPRIVTPLLLRITARDKMYIASTAESALLKILEVSSEKTISILLPILFELLKKEKKDNHYQAIVEILGEAAKVANEEEVSVIVDNLVESLPDQINFNNYSFFRFVFDALVQAGKRVSEDKVSVLVETVLSFLERSETRSTDKYGIIDGVVRAIKVLAQMTKIPVHQILRATFIFLKELQVGPRDIFITPAILKATKKLVQSHTLQQMPDVIENLSKILDFLLPFVKRISRKGSDKERQDIAKALNQLKEAFSIQDPANGVSILLEKTIHLQGYLAATLSEAQRPSKKESKEFSPSATDDIDMLLIEWKNPDPLISRSAIIKMGEMVAILPTPADTSKVIEALAVAKKHGDHFIRDYVKRVLSLIPLRKFLECFATINWPQILPVFLEQIFKRGNSIFLQETSSGLSLCLNENNQIVSHPLDPQQLQFLINWSKTEAPLLQYTTSYL